MYASEMIAEAIPAATTPIPVSAVRAWRKRTMRTLWRKARLWVIDVADMEFVLFGSSGRLEGLNPGLRMRLAGAAVCAATHSGASSRSLTQPTGPQLTAVNSGTGSGFASHSSHMAALQEKS